jgi:hypothetical protein
MITIRKSNDRGQSQLAWLQSFHTFSFAEYHDPKFVHFGPLRVINEDTIQPGKGFGRHPHRHMEIITYVVEGSLEHKDSLGTGSIIRPGEIQRMSAGEGIEHSEFNHSNTDSLHLLQIWILPENSDVPSSYEQKPISKKPNQFILIGSRKGGAEAITIHQDVELFVAYLTPNQTIKYELKNGRKGWLQLIKGNIAINGQMLSAGDAVGITDENELIIQSFEEAEFLFFDLKYSGQKD